MLPWLLSNIQADQALQGIIRLGDETVVEVLTEEEAIFEHMGKDHITATLKSSNLQRTSSISTRQP